jgi:hypothetical protein
MSAGCTCGPVRHWQCNAGCRAERAWPTFAIELSCEGTPFRWTGRGENSAKACGAAITSFLQNPMIVAERVRVVSCVEAGK